MVDEGWRGPRRGRRRRPPLRRMRKATVIWPSSWAAAGVVDAADDGGLLGAKDGVDVFLG